MNMKRNLLAMLATALFASENNGVPPIGVKYSPIPSFGSRNYNNTGRQLNQRQKRKRIRQNSNSKFNHAI